MAEEQRILAFGYWLLNVMKKNFLQFFQSLNTLQENPFYDFLIAERFF